MLKRYPWLWWLILISLWLTCTAADQLWLFHDQSLPAWDQADYLNSALDHGRALGLLKGGGWLGWDSLLDLSPKIPPLSSLVSGTVMALSGDSPDSASWVLSLWNGLLIMVVACWGRQLDGAGLGLLAATLASLAPALAAARVDFTLDMPITASSTLALWLLGRWQRQSEQGGQWSQAMLAAFAIGMALLVKQSALLMLAPPAIWASWRALQVPKRRYQSLAAFVVVLAMVTPWLHHNWITTLGGTNRAVITSGAKEGDPGSFDPRSLIWYPPLLPRQLGQIQLIAGMAGFLLLGWRQRNTLSKFWQKPFNLLTPGWPWLLGCGLSGWLFISLSPNKDARYIAPLLPLFALILARGWLIIGDYINKTLGTRLAWGLLGAGLLMSGSSLVDERLSALQTSRDSPAAELITALRRQVGTNPTTLLMAASHQALNEHTLSYLGRRQGGQILVRRLGRDPKDNELALAQAEWWVLATGNQGTTRQSARELSKRVRQDGRFEKLQSWPWDQGRTVELWRRKAAAAKPEPFDQRFIDVAQAMQEGPTGLSQVFESIGPWHLLDPHMSYQPRVQRWALQQLKSNPENSEALWSLALIAVLQNRPDQADHWLSQLEQITGIGSWPTAYRSVVLLANWESCKTAQLADQPTKRDDNSTETTVLAALRDLGRSLCFDPRGPIGLSRSLPEAVRQLEQQIQRPDS